MPVGRNAGLIDRSVIGLRIEEAGSQFLPGLVSIRIETGLLRGPVGLRIVEIGSQFLRLS